MYELDGDALAVLAPDLILIQDLPGRWGARCAAQGGRSVAAEWADLPAADVVVVAPCGMDLSAAVAQAEIVAARLPDVPVIAIDSGALVVQAGPGLVDGIEALAWALHPDVVPAPPPGRVVRPRATPF